MRESRVHVANGIESFLHSTASVTLGLCTSNFLWEEQIRSKHSMRTRVIAGVSKGTGGARQAVENLCFSIGIAAESTPRSVHWPSSDTAPFCVFSAVSTSLFRPRFFLDTLAALSWIFLLLPVPLAADAAGRERVTRSTGGERSFCTAR